VAEHQEVVLEVLTDCFGELDGNANCDPYCDCDEKYREAGPVILLSGCSSGDNSCPGCDDPDADPGS